jgi:aspartyl-tRNA(Asn)/glutamyl-tRNA(Gln) amidotransferase subunit C
MSLSNEEVTRIAELARLRLSEEETELYRRQLTAIVDFIDHLGDYETVQESPPEVAAREAQDVARALDPETETGLLERYLHNAPDRLDTFVMVPQVKGS